MKVKIMNYKKIIAFYSILLFILIYASPLITTESKANLGPPTVKININPYTIIYEGDVIDCNITGNPTVKYWFINNQSDHTTFYGDDPVIFDPEPTPLDKTYVNLTVYAENDAGKASDNVIVMIKRIFFGDIHFHSRLSDGKYPIDTLYTNAIKDNYLDFVCLSDHAEIIDCALRNQSPNSFLRDSMQVFIDKILGRSEWQVIKNKAIQYYNPGRFTTFLGFEWSASWEFPGGTPDLDGTHCKDKCHINFYYRDVYPNALKYSAMDEYTFDEIFQAMYNESKKGDLNIGFPHHPLVDNGAEINAVNWTFLADGIKNTDARDAILRGVETYSCWGSAVGQYSNIPISWPYGKRKLCNQTDFWVENGMWEWSENARKDEKFAMMASSDIHFQSRPGSAKPRASFSFGMTSDKPAGIIAVYAVHNTRGEIWDAMNNCNMYGTQLLKIRANVRLDGQLANGRWINCSSPLKIQITACSTFPGLDSSGRNMKPYGYLFNKLDYPIQDIWLIKKDSLKGQPWCKVIGHATPNDNSVVVTFEDPNVQPNDFYWVAIRQKGQELKPGQNEYMAFIGPVFIDNVV
jgi:hypothetical protein